MPKREVYPPCEHQYAGAGCWLAVVLASIIGWLLAAAWLALLPLSILLTAPLGLHAWDQLRDWRARRDASVLRRRGVKALLIYSRSPHWQPYIEENWLPRIPAGVEILDWSDRKQWRPDDRRVRIFNRLVESPEDYNPAAVVFRPNAAPLVFRFYPAFRNAKHGNVEGLKMLEEEFFRALEE